MKIQTIGYLILGSALFAVSAPAQILDVKRAVKNKIENRVNNKVDQKIDKELDKTEKAITDTVAKAENEPAEVQAGQDQVKPSQPQLQTYSKYDFIAGEKVFFFEDFSQDNIGDFPALWNTNASGEVVNTNLFPGKWFQLKGEGFFIPDTQGDFPENFTVEFDWITVMTDELPSMDLGFYIVSGNIKDPAEGGAIPGLAGIKVNLSESVSSYDTYADGSYVLNGSKDVILQKDTKYHVAIWIQKQRFRLYINETKFFDAPRAMPLGYKYNVLRYEMSGASSPLITNFRVAAGLPDMRSKLLTDGKLVTYGIYFDVNSDKVKPESYGTLKGIAAVLTENPDVKVRIIGFTDADGNDVANLELSKKRAAAVKNELAKSFAIDASRMETDGKGEGEPVAPNDNPTNKALNRRVEFIKL